MKNNNKNILGLQDYTKSKFSLALNRVNVEIAGNRIAEIFEEKKHDLLMLFKYN